MARDYTTKMFNQAQGYRPAGRAPLRNPIKDETKITQSFRAYWNAIEAGVVVSFRFHGQEFGAYFTFDRETKKLQDVEYTVGDDAKTCVMPAGVDYNALEATARKEF